MSGCERRTFRLKAAAEGDNSRRCVTFVAETRGEQRLVRRHCDAPAYQPEGRQLQGGRLSDVTSGEQPANGKKASLEYLSEWIS